MTHQFNRREFIVGGAAAALAPMLPAAAQAAQDWPQWRGTQRDGVWRESGITQTLPKGQLPLRWKAAVSGGYSGPTVAGGKVYVTDRIVEPKEQERTLCFDAATGKPLWTHAWDVTYKGLGYPDGPRASVTIFDGRAYSVGAMGTVNCYDAGTGAVLWAHDFGTKYPIRLLNQPGPFWGISAAPLIEGGLVILHHGGAPDACIIALDRKTGEERWRALSDVGAYSSPIIVRQAGRRVLVCWTAQNVVGLDPLTGRTYWTQPFPSKNVVIAIADPVVHGDMLYLTSFYQGSLMLRLHADRLAADRMWERVGQNERSTDALHSIISTPLMLKQEGKDYIYGVDSYGELRCLDAKTGDRLWENLDAVPKARWSTIHFVKEGPAGDRIWMFNERGQVLIGKLTPKGFEELGRADLLKPTMGQLPQRGGVCWSHPAYANRRIFARNDEELVCADLSA